MTGTTRQGARYRARAVRARSRVSIVSSIAMRMVSTAIFSIVGIMIIEIVMP